MMLRLVCETNPAYAVAMMSLTSTWAAGENK
jgi:hypothetical protein